MKPTFKMCMVELDAVLQLRLVQLNGMGVMFDVKWLFVYARPRQESCHFFGPIQQLASLSLARIINIILLPCFHIALNIAHLNDTREGGSGICDSSHVPSTLPIITLDGPRDVLQYTPTRILSQREDSQRNHYTPGQLVIEGTMDPLEWLAISLDSTIKTGWSLIHGPTAPWQQ
ncbi:uncharacterized protein ARMOST_11451 [Armillaria ostoyae]|uniref:Uncharacterized protein n=1 Tax=Armillaria ostoyae TaxID=47428 RepID=A0A284RH60_ARMOS|nr:uncharacterized protein ARMOST_11451 [Armillaria ostoyae]